MPRKNRASEIIRDDIIDAAFTLAAEQGWRTLSLTAIAAAAGCDLAGVRRHFSSKAAILTGLIRRTDAAVLAGRGSGAEGDDSPKDRLFDLIMGRFDALAPHKAALSIIFNDFKRSPLLGACALPQVLCSMAWMLEAAGIHPSGVRGALKVNGLALIYARAWAIWLKDDSVDLAVTMAAVDRLLSRAEKTINWCSGRMCQDRQVAV